MQHAVDAKAYGALLAARLDMDIAGTLLEGVLEQPVDDVDDVRVVGVRLLVAGAEVQQLFEFWSTRVAPLTDLARRKNSTV